MASTRVVRKVKVEGKWQFLPVTRVGEKRDWGKLDLHGTPITSIPGTFYLEHFHVSIRITFRHITGKRARSQPRPVNAWAATEICLIAIEKRPFFHRHRYALRILAD